MDHVRGEHLPDHFLRPAPCPPRQGRKTPGLIYPKAGVKVDLVALDDRVSGFLSHWWQDAAMPCIGIDNGCPACEAGRAARWYGYLPALWLPSRMPRLAVITAGAYRESPKLQELEGQLRGWRIRLERVREVQTAPVRVVVLGKDPEPRLPASWCVTNGLAVLWRLEGLLKAMRSPDEPQEPQEAVL